MLSGTRPTGGQRYSLLSRSGARRFGRARSSVSSGPTGSWPPCGIWPSGRWFGELSSLLADYRNPDSDAASERVASGGWRAGLERRFGSLKTTAISTREHVWSHQAFTAVIGSTSCMAALARTASRRSARDRPRVSRGQAATGQRPAPCRGDVGATLHAGRVPNLIGDVRDCLDAAVFGLR